MRDKRLTSRAENWGWINNTQTTVSHLLIITLLIFLGEFFSDFLAIYFISSFASEPLYFIQAEFVAQRYSYPSQIFVLNSDLNNHYTFTGRIRQISRKKFKYEIFRLVLSYESKLRVRDWYVLRVIAVWLNVLSSIFLSLKLNMMADWTFSTDERIDSLKK